MNEPISEVDQELRDTSRVSLVIAITVNKGKRNACLVLGIIALAVILFFGWNNWLLLLPAALGIGAFLHQMNILIISSELRRRSKEPEQLGEPEEADTQGTEERERKTKFLESHREMVKKRAAEYMVEHPDVSLEDVVDFVTEKCFREHEIARIKAELEAKKAEIEATIAGYAKGKSPPRPLGNLTYDEASYYFTKYCELLEEGVGPRAKESRLPTSVERMKEALKVECLNWCNHGKDFDESCEFIVTGYAMLARFLPDELAEKSAFELGESEDKEVLRVYYEASEVASELQKRKMNELNAEWNEFQEKYRAKYGS